MIKQYIYCDECNERMDYDDSDGDKNINGYTVKGELVLSMNQRTHYGSRGWPLPEFSANHLCSTNCFKSYVNRFIDEVVNAGEVTREIAP